MILSESLTVACLHGSPLRIRFASLWLRDIPVHDPLRAHSGETQREVTGNNGAGRAPDAGDTLYIPSAEPISVKRAAE
ncbi:hypothetical protein [Streptomyces sp. NPDC093984]|uniref:hypothetical protein n=1 Tax=Streptomyces sp. NPDC093984 TaxID=3366052 RepID=UPI00381501C8